MKEHIFLDFIPKGKMDSANKPVLWQYSTTKIKWPHQTRPPPLAWNIWKKYIKTFTTGTPTLKLRQPLGLWLLTTHLQRHWNFIKFDNDIIQTTSSSQTYYTKIESRHDNVYTIQTQPLTVFPELTSPIIPYIINKDTIFCRDAVQIDLHHAHDNLQECKNTDIICTKINNIHHNDPNNKIIMCGTGVITQQNISISGIIAIDEQIGWEIQGVLPMQHNPSPLTTDAYSCYYTLQQIISLIQAKEIMTKHIVYLTSNKNLQQQLNKIAKRIISPTMCIANEYTILKAISTLLQQHSSISIQYIKQTNTYHNELFARSTTLAQQAQHFQPAQHRIANTIQLTAEILIDNKKVSSDLTSNLRTAFATPQLWDYYKEKFNWSIECIKTIDWTSHGIALNNLHHRQKKTIIQFNHRWLPLNTSHSLQFTGTARLCPLLPNRRNPFPLFIMHTFTF
jgi:hypothetical protein